MGKTKSHHKKSLSNQFSWKNLVIFLLWTSLFTLAYSQAPLYTSNQNQYFLHGLAKAGYGFLANDWLANTLDSTPVFSLIVKTLYALFHWQGLFYGVFGLLSGVYLFSLAAIVKQIWQLENDRLGNYALLTMLILVNSALLRFLVARLLGLNWDYLFDGGVAGQRLLGVVLQPSTFGVFLLLSIYFFLERKYSWAVIFLILPPFVHPTYLLSAGILALVYMGLVFMEDRSIRSPFFIGLASLIGVTPTLIHTYNVFSLTDSIVGKRAQKILVFERIPHHAVIAEWFNLSVVVKLLFIVIAIILLWRRIPDRKRLYGTSQGRLFHIFFWLFSVACGLTVITYLSGNLSLALIFPWRISTLLVPLSVAIIIGVFLDNLINRWSPWLTKHARSFMVISLLISIGFAGNGLEKTLINAQQKRESPEHSLLTYIASHKEDGQNYLTPVKMQDFRLATGAPQFVDFKSIPYKDIEIIEWNRRLHAAMGFYRSPKKKNVCKQMVQFASEGVTHVVLPESHIARACPGLSVEYQDGFYRLVQIRSP